MNDAQSEEKIRKKPRLLPATENSSKSPFLRVKRIKPKYNNPKIRTIHWLEFICFLDYRLRFGYDFDVEFPEGNILTEIQP